MQYINSNTVGLFLWRPSQPSIIQERWYCGWNLPCSICVQGLTESPKMYKNVKGGFFTGRLCRWSNKMWAQKPWCRMIYIFIGRLLKSTVLFFVYVNSNPLTFQVDSTTRSFLNNLLRTHIILYYVIQSFQSLQVYLALGKQSSLRSLAKLLGVVIFSKETYGF